MNDFMGYGPTTISRRFRWTFEANIEEHIIVPVYVKLNSRPQLKIEEVQQEDGSYKIVENSQKWLPIKILFFDLDHHAESLWKFTSFIYKENETLHKGQMTLKLWDGVGNLLESWVLDKAHFTSVHILDNYASCDLEFTVEYDGVEYKNHFGPSIPIVHDVAKDGISPEVSPDVTKIEVVTNNHIIITDGIVASDSGTTNIKVTEGIPEKITIESIPDIKMPPYVIPCDPNMKFPPIIFSQPMTEEELKGCKPIVPFPPDKHV